MMEKWQNPGRCSLAAWEVSKLYLKLYDQAWSNFKYLLSPALLVCVVVYTWLSSISVKIDRQSWPNFNITSP